MNTNFLNFDSTIYMFHLHEIIELIRPSLPIVFSDLPESGEPEAGADGLVGLGSTLGDTSPSSDQPALSAVMLRELQGWDTLGSLQVAEPGRQLLPDIRGGSGALADAENPTIDPALLALPPSGRDGQLPDSALGGHGTPQTGPPGDVMAAVARLPVELGDLLASAQHNPKLLASLSECVSEYSTWSPGPQLPKCFKSRLSKLLCERDGKWYCQLSGCTVARKGQQREDRAQWHLLTNHFGFRFSCHVW
jgi:hypothetical protein